MSRHPTRFGGPEFDSEGLVNTSLRESSCQDSRRLVRLRLKKGSRHFLSVYGVGSDLDGMVIRFRKGLEVFLFRF